MTPVLYQMKANNGRRLSSKELANQGFCGTSTPTTVTHILHAKYFAKPHFYGIILKSIRNDGHLIECPGRGQWIERYFGGVASSVRFLYSSSLLRPMRLSKLLRAPKNIRVEFPFGKIASDATLRFASACANCPDLVELRFARRFKTGGHFIYIFI